MLICCFKLLDQERRMADMVSLQFDDALGHYQRQIYVPNVILSVPVETERRERSCWSSRSTAEWYGFNLVRLSQMSQNQIYFSCLILIHNKNTAIIGLRTITLPTLVLQNFKMENSSSSYPSDLWLDEIWGCDLDVILSLMQSEKLYLVLRTLKISTATITHRKDIILTSNLLQLPAHPKNQLSTNRS